MSFRRACLNIHAFLAFIDILIKLTVNKYLPTMTGIVYLCCYVNGVRKCVEKHKSGILYGCRFYIYVVL